MTVTSGVIQLGCAAWVAETMLSQEAMKDVAEPGYRYPFGAGALSGTEYGDWVAGVGTNGSKRYRSTSRCAQPSNFKVDCREFACRFSFSPPKSPSQRAPTLYSGRYGGQFQQ